MWTRRGFSSMIGGLVGLVVFGMTGTARASLLLDTVTCGVQPSFLWSCNPPQAVVGGGTEFILKAAGSTQFAIDIGASSFSMNYIGLGLNTGAGEVLLIQSLDWFNDPSGIIIGIANFFTNAGGMGPSDVTFGQHSVQIVYNNAQWRPGRVLSFDFVTDHVVPEPSALALFTIGLFGLGVMTRRRRVV